MDPLLRSTIFKVAIPALVIAVVLIVSRLRGFSWTEDLRLIWPKPATVFLWVAFWIAWVIASEIVTRAMGIAQPAPWKDYPPLIILLRITAIGILGPIAEEIVMRGIVFFQLARTRLGPRGAIVLCAAAWAAMHVQYDWKTISLIFLDGLVLGTARHRSRSVYVPMILHILGNLYSIYQSLYP